MKNNHGFTLVEILASITILFLLGTVFFQTFIFSQKATSDNQDKLVAINLAQSVLEEVKVKSVYEEIGSPGTYGSPVCIEDASNESGCNSKYQKWMNGKDYYIEIVVSEEHEKGLYPVEVKVYCNGGNLKSSVKGLVEL